MSNMVWCILLSRQMRLYQTSLFKSLNLWMRSIKLERLLQTQSLKFWIRIERSLSTCKEIWQWSHLFSFSFKQIWWEAESFQIWSSNNSQSCLTRLKQRHLSDLMNSLTCSLQSSRTSLEITKFSSAMHFQSFDGSCLSSFPSLNLNQMMSSSCL